MDERLKRLAEEAARLVEKTGSDPVEALRGLEAELSKEDACRIAEALRGLVEGYRAIEEGGVPSNAYLALDAVYRAARRLCGSSVLDEELARLVLAVLGLLAAGKAARAASIASIIESRLSRGRGL